MMSPNKICAITDESIQYAQQLIKAGELIVVPTDTVYGIACDPTNSEAVKKLFTVKERPLSKSIQVIISDLNDLQQLGLELPQPLDILAEGLLPGGFSPIATVKTEESPLVTMKHEEDGTQTQAIRIPDCPSLNAIVRMTGPLACTSANKSGETSASTVMEAYTALGNDVALYLDAGPTPGSTGSTVVAADPQATDGIIILREGVIPSAVIHHYAIRANAFFMPASLMDQQGGKTLNDALIAVLNTSQFDQES